MPLKNLPTSAAVPLANLVTQRPGQVSSMSLSRSDAASITLLAFASGESVSEEEYFADTLYYAVEGTALLVFSDRRERLPAGSAIMVPANVEHAVEGEGGCAFKLLQLSL